MKARALLLVSIALLMGALTAARTAQSAALAIVNARVWTGDPTNPRAQALRIEGDRIVRVGTNEDVRGSAGATQILDAAGRLIVPGFIDTHVHFIDGGAGLAGVQLRDAKTREEFVARVAAFAKTQPPGTWITGGDWDHTLWGGTLPERAWIDAVTPRNPVLLSRLDGHMALANSAALRAAHITRDAKNVEGGEIVRDGRGELTGVFKDNAMDLIYAVVPPLSAQQQDRALTAAMKYVNAQGVTSVHNMGTWSDLETFARAHQAGTLSTRIYAAVPLADWQRLQDALAQRRYGGRDGRGDEWLRVGGLKGFVDGSLGSHTAAFFEPFTDAPADRGLLVNSAGESLRSGSPAPTAPGCTLWCTRSAIAPSGCCSISTNGSRRSTARATGASASSTRNTSRATDIPRFAQLGVIASMQPYHAIDDGRWAEKLIGERIRDHLRVPLAARFGARARLWQRLVGRAGDAAGGHLRRRDATHARRQATRRAGYPSRKSASKKPCVPIQRPPLMPRSRKRAKAS